ncbi:sigma-54-dependent transcriptional regulator [Pyruvatibacter mobilis]|jgi:two-component system nitrogen regulation response regulator NtrX|uniref:Response regulator n=1 Tax=Pyruvatibacter mobilis TaxID=1712261 RepID=A0A845QCE0_9HYPH|nr:sigma-54 dependent transcriptional regulator [Pyruvatibacter mobilis]NBG96104.1 response regulator [Pyruvatibacter mobilis]QJD75217.1 sigma-54-dependent Fis family transcriptional regulator [Pyruvatibacter mobilis]GGD13740.1 sigma-54-dependent Fis family transcriptional regulator [Pyruvatibacter mobilis]
MASDILIVDDEFDIRELMAGILEDEGYETRLAANSDETLKAIQARVPRLVVLDVWLQGSRMDGLDLLAAIKEKHPDLPVVVISGHGNVETAVTAIKNGAYDYIEKPFKADRLVLIVKRALEASTLKRENEELRQRSSDEAELVGNSSSLNQLRQMVDRIAPTNSRVLITGPSGCGKEVVARMLHARSLRTTGDFVVINAATMAPERMEEELFGVEAAEGRPAKVGVFEQAHKGTLFLDEVADMPLETQGKILRVLVDQTFERLGGGPRVQVDVRVVSSSSRDLTTEIAAGRFREDLYHRLNVVPITVPALADRREDIPVLAEHFMDRIASATGLSVRKIGEDAMAALQAHDWPGNVRQLRNNIERLLILASGDKDGAITADMLPSEVARTTPQVGEGEAGQNIMALPLREARESFERQYLMAQIRRFGGNISRTAAFIGMERSALHRKLKSLGVTTSNRSEVSA